MLLQAETLQDSVVVEVCDEPEGKVERSIYPMDLTLDNLGIFWEKSRQFRTLFLEEINGDFKKFCELFISYENGHARSHGLFWVIDDFVGIFYMTHMTDVDAQTHYTFFDRRHKGRENLTKSMIRYAFNEFGFRRLSVEIPAYVGPNTFGFTYALGFKKEGRKRNASFYKNKWFDVVCFGILREEALNEQ